MEPLGTSNTDAAVINKSKKPTGSAFKQQKLPAWQPILTAGTVLPTFFIIGILFIPVGIGLWYFSDNVSEHIIEYTDCMSEEYPNKTCADVIGPEFGKGPVPDCTCILRFNLTEDFKGRVYLYYALTNFYQNHRRYVKSRDDNQLYQGSDAPSKDCYPFDKDESGNYIWPCGAIANSMFQDEINLYSEKTSSPKLVSLQRTDIAWESDIEFKFKNPSNWNTTEFRAKHVKPKAWKKSPWDLDPINPKNNGLENEDFIIWMRTAALPNFRKLYRIVKDEGKDGLDRGGYHFKISYSYPVKSFQGTKSVILSTTSLLGGKNTFLGISYVVVGSVCLLLGIVFLFVHINCGKSTFEMTNVDPRTPF